MTVRKKILAYLLLVSITLSMIPVTQVSANDTNNATGNESQSTAIEQANNEAVTPDDESADNKQDSSDSSNDKNQSENKINVLEDQGDESIFPLDYLYLGSPVVYSDEEQEFVVSWNGDFDSIKLIFENLDTSQETVLTPTLQEDTLTLFTKTFSDSDTGVYKVTKIVTVEEGVENIYELSENGIDSFFGVNKEYVGNEKSEVIEIDSSAIEEELLEEAGINIVSLDDESLVLSEQKIEEAIVEAVEGDSINSASSSQTSASSSQTSASATYNLVIVIDPGHDDKHTGARGLSGILEEVVTFKISQYLKTELEKYSGVKVYLSRTSAKCPYPTTANNLTCIQERVNAASKLGASAFISIHLNASNGSARGAEVYYHKDSAGGKVLATNVQKELVKLGLYDRKVKQNQEYRVIKAAQEKGFPGIIIEHAFLDNSGDVSGYLNSDSKLKQLAQADARGIANSFASLNSTVVWEHDGTGWKCKDSAGIYMVSKWYRDSKGNWYYFNSDGYMLTGFQTISGVNYCFLSSGIMAIGWVKSSGDYYYFDSNGAGKSNFWVKHTDNKWYYLGSDGKMLTGSQTIKGIEYFFLSNGSMVTGWVKASGTYYYYDSKGANIKESWVKDNNNWYYLDSEGKMLTGLQTIKEINYYFLSNGIMATGWVELSGDYYYYDSKGANITNSWVKHDNNWYFVDSAGKRLTGLQTINSIKYCFLSDGIMVIGWVKLSGDYYYYDSKGANVTDSWVKDNNKWYYLDSEGKMLTGFQTIKEIDYLFFSNGSMATDWVKVSGDYYYFDSKGAMKSNYWIKHTDNKWYYLGPDGKMLTGFQTIKGIRYCFLSNGSMATGWVKSLGEYYYFDSNGAGKSNYWIKHTDNKWYYFGSEGKMLTGFQTIKNIRYCFLSDGSMATGWVKSKGLYYYFDSNGAGKSNYWIKHTNNKWYYLGADGIMVYGCDLRIGGKDYTFNDDGSLYEGYEITGTSKITAAQLERFYTKSGNTYPAYYATSDAPTLTKFCQIYVEEAAAENIMVEVAFAQAMLETGWLKFGGDVPISYYNFAGIGATGNGNKGHDFDTVRQGIRAQIQHLKAYANTAPLNINPAKPEDPRFELVNPRGTARFVEWLGQQENPQGKGWATGKDYGNKIVALIKELKKA